MHWGFVFLPIIFLAVLAGFVALIVVVARAATARPQAYPQAPMAPPPGSRETPLDILARRFASGEITAEEYQKARDLLQGGPTS